ncbi:MAG TPA: hypothetical protein VFH97_04660 [Gemmatimonadales bacterium]|nr:hypothetical protein [Gemmatimonadales bacterium]
MIHSFALFALFALFACSHGEPFASAPPDSLGPFTSTLPRPLTLNPAADVTPSAAGDTVVFSRQDEGRPDGDYCLALLPLEGGTLYGTRCAGGLEPDTVRDAWLNPVISPDRARLAYLRDREVVRSGRELGHVLVVAPWTFPDSATIVVRGSYPLSDTTVGNAFRRPAWAGDGAIRFLGGLEESGPNATFVPGGVWEVPVGADPAPEPHRIPELADAVAFSQRGDGAVFFLSGSDPTGVYQWLPGTAPSPVAPFTCDDTATLAQLTAVAAGTGGVAAIGTCLTPAGSRIRLLWNPLDSGGPVRWLRLPVEPEHVTGVPGRPRLIVESGGDLWLVGIP